MPPVYFTTKNFVVLTILVFVTDLSSHGKNGFGWNRVSSTVIVLIVLFYFLVRLVTGQATLNTECTPSLYYDTAEMHCLACPSPQISSPSNPYVCTCPSGYSNQYSIDTSGEQILYCIQCEYAVSRDGSQCMSCDSTSIFDSQTMDCSCSPGMIVVETSQTGELFPNKTCMACPQGISRRFFVCFMLIQC